MKEIQICKTRILIVGHNVLDKRTAFGKTLISFFKGWDNDYIAQLYFHSEVPTCDICSNYFRITDVEIFHNVFRRHKNVGKKFDAYQIDEKRSSSRTDKGLQSKIYSFGRKRSSLIYMARNFIWKHAKWFSEELRKWINDFSPKVIFFVAGDYAFAYDITFKLAEEFNIPVVMYCCDDFFINRANPQSVLSKKVYKELMKSVRRCMTKTYAVITICDKMTDAYKKVFDKPIYTVYTGYSTIVSPAEEKKKSVVYLGNLGYNRADSLVDIGRALKEISAETGINLQLDVYSSENRPKILRKLKLKNGIDFHGAVGADEVRKIISESVLVLHVESFKKKNIYKVEYSVSTKIADLLVSGVCIFAYGPDKVASMEYLADNSAAIVVNDKTRLKAELLNAISDGEFRSYFIKNAQILADKNHNSRDVAKNVRDIILSAKQVKSL